MYVIAEAAAVDLQPAAAFRSSIWNADVGSKFSTYSFERTRTVGRQFYRQRIPWTYATSL